MMKKTLILFVSIFAIFLVASNGVLANDSGVKVRMIHASTDAPAFDIYVNNDRILNGLNFKEISDYQSMRAGEFDLQVYHEEANIDEEDPILEEQVKFTSKEAYTLAISKKVEDLQLRVYKDDLTLTDKSKFRVVHLSDGAPTLDIWANEEVFISEVAPDEDSQYVEEDAGTYHFSIMPSGEKSSVFEIPNVSLDEGSNYSGFVVGILNGEPALDIILTKDIERKE
ncbi:DUF4397 domain-containing protein [Bacillus shivajii]|uniref:DUF4397 domain-containing protein n=1 Tax=Bacillus shivajii TaxID=1983719 RepID=UPI001CFBCDBB|nr:DUF4397 domain-containing protein [Bacillus shivajii]UCZ54902.1 DUF4397 domain-containing protein [Bacillus shivajii]